MNKWLWKDTEVEFSMSKTRRCPMCNGFLVTKTYYGECETMCKKIKYKQCALCDFNSKELKRL